MKQLRLICLLLPCLLCCSLAARQYSAASERLLRQLDSTIAVKEDYTRLRRAQISDALARLRTDSTDQERYSTLRTLFGHYRAFMGDSAMWVAEKRLEIARRLREPAKIYSASLNLADSYTHSGNYHSAFGILDTLPRNQLAPYQLKYLYSVYGRAFSEMALSDGVQAHRLGFRRKVQEYRDSAMLLLPDTTRDYFNLQAWRIMDAGHWSEALEVMNRANKIFGSRGRAASISQLAEIYHNLQNNDAEIACLAEAAIIDLQNGVRDYTSLMTLAIRLNENGDVRRAYAYIRCALEDAYLSQAKSRTTSILEMVPVIDAAYNAAEQKRASNLRLFLIVISILAIGLGAALFLAHKQLRLNQRIRLSLRQSNREIQEINTQLKASNELLSEANHAREGYISTLFDAHSGYINRTLRLRKQITRLLKAGQIDKALDTISSGKDENDELKALYSRFDEIFLSLYPRFIADLNNCLKPECRFNENLTSLTAELRVLALMRIGVTSSARIADLLHYNPQTVYNHKSAIRSALSMDKEEFERRISSLGE